MPGKMARSAPRPTFGLPEVLVAVRTSRLSCKRVRLSGILVGVELALWTLQLMPGDLCLPSPQSAPCARPRHDQTTQRQAQFISLAAPTAARARR